MTRAAPPDRGDPGPRDSRAASRPTRLVGPVSQAELARLYADTDVVLKLSRIEGMFGPPLEGFHCGATCVVTPVTGHDEYVGPRLERPRHRVG